MKITVVLGVFEQEALECGQVMTKESFGLLDDLARKVDAEVRFVYAVPEEKWAGNAKGVKVAVWREHRPALLDAIRAQEPDIVYALGSLALHSLANKGNATQKAYRRREFSVPELPGVPCHTSFGLDQVWVKSGYGKWIGMDLVAALKGQVTTEYPETVVLQPGTKEWNICPKELQDFLRG